MTKKQLTAVIAAVLALAGSVGTSIASLASSNESGERIRAVEVRQEEAHRDIGKRLDRLETKLDRLIERASK